MLVITTDSASAPENEAEDDGYAGSDSKKKRGPKTKAELQAQLAERDPYKLLELDELRWRASAEDIRRCDKPYLHLHRLTLVSSRTRLWRRPQGVSPSCAQVPPG